MNSNTRQQLVNQRVREILQGRGVVQEGPRYYSGSGVVQEGPQYYSGAGVVTEGPEYFSGNGVVTEGPRYYSGAGKRHICPHCNGSGFFDDLWSGIKSGVSSIADTVLPIIKEVGPSLIKALPMMALGKNKTHQKINKRGQMISKLMRSHGMTLPEASKYLKSQGY